MASGRLWAPPRPPAVALGRRARSSLLPGTASSTIGRWSINHKFRRKFSRTSVKPGPSRLFCAEILGLERDWGAVRGAQGGAMPSGAVAGESSGVGSGFFGD
jgi:hypothetical protein